MIPSAHNVIHRPLVFNPWFPCHAPFPPALCTNANFNNDEMFGLTPIPFICTNANFNNDEMFGLTPIPFMISWRTG
jgi:hypothetical protein